MIGYLKGLVTEVDNDSCIVDVQGVGYLIYCSEGTLFSLREKLDTKVPVKILTRVLHREDVLDIYGFLHRDEYTLFNMLLRVSGVGPKQALKILGMGKTSQIISAIVSGDDSFLMQLSGIGKKRAQQIIFDLRERLKNAFEVAPAERSSDFATAVSALEKLGFSGVEARDAVDRVVASQGSGLDAAQLIERALKQLSTGV
jgi:Holliday junction DNA helicase RuvA